MSYLSPIFEELFNAISFHMGGAVNLRRIAAPMWGDADAIDAFYIDIASDENNVVIDGLTNANVAIPPDPETVTPDTLYDKAMFDSVWLYPRAVINAGGPAYP